MTTPPVTPWLTVVMPVHEGAAMLAATLASAAAEDTAGITFLILDSSSDDACRRIAGAFAPALSLLYLPRPDLKPWPAKMNAGVALARTRHVAILHQDDLWLPGHVDAMRRSLAAQPEAVLHIAPAELADAEGRMLGRWSLPLPPGRHDEDAVRDRLLVQNFIAITTPVVQRDAWLAVGGMDEQLWYTADWDLYLKLARHGTVAVAAEATTAFRIHAGSLTVTGSRDLAGLRAQHDIVLARHGHGAARSILRRARASATINCALAAAAGGDLAALIRALGAMLRLGPAGLLRYLHESRLVDRVMPRVRARLAGVF